MHGRPSGILSQRSSGGEAGQHRETTLPKLPLEVRPCSGNVRGLHDPPLLPGLAHQPCPTQASLCTPSWTGEEAARPEAGSSTAHSNHLGSFNSPCSGRLPDQLKRGLWKGVVGVPGAPCPAAATSPGNSPETQKSRPLLPMDVPGTWHGASATTLPPPGHKTSVKARHPWWDVGVCTCDRGACPTSGLPFK